jgi:hypothetical protein
MDVVIDVERLEAQFQLQVLVQQAEGVLQEELCRVAGRDIVALQVNRLVQQRRAVGIAVDGVVARLGAVIVVFLQPDAGLQLVEAELPAALGRHALARAVDGGETVLQPLGRGQPRQAGDHLGVVIALGGRIVLRRDAVAALVLVIGRRGQVDRVGDRRVQGQAVEVVLPLVDRELVIVGVVGVRIDDLPRRRSACRLAVGTITVEPSGTDSGT